MDLAQNINKLYWGIREKIYKLMDWKIVIYNFCIKIHKMPGISISKKMWICAGYGEINPHNFKLCCKRGNYERMMDKGAQFVNEGLLGALLGNNHELAMYFIRRGAKNFNHILYHGAKKNKPNIVDFCLQYTTNINVGFIGACQKGHMDMVKKFINLGSNDWNVGLS